MLLFWRVIRNRLTSVLNLCNDNPLYLMLFAASKLIILEELKIKLFDLYFSLSNLGKINLDDPDEVLKKLNMAAGFLELSTLKASHALK